MARKRVRAAARKLAALTAAQEGLERRVPVSGRAAVDEIAAGVRRTGLAIVDLAQPGALWWLAPLQYIAEQMSVRVCASHDLDPGERDDVAAYLLAGLQEFVHALAADFDPVHFRAWTAAIVEREQRSA